MLGAIDHSQHIPAPTSHPPVPDSLYKSDNLTLPANLPTLGTQTQPGTQHYGLAITSAYKNQEVITLTFFYDSYVSGSFNESVPASLAPGWVELILWTH